MGSEPLTSETALKRVLKNALCHDGLARGIRECARMLDKRRVHLCVLAKNCTEPAYSKLIKALCTEHAINLLEVDDNSELGEWAGLCKIDAEGNARKVVSALVSASPTTVSSPRHWTFSSRTSPSKQFFSLRQLIPGFQ